MFKSFVLATLQAYLATAQEDESTCLKEGGEWIFNEYYPYCIPAFMVCKNLNDGSEWDWAASVCKSPPDPEEMKRACENDKGEWRTDPVPAKCITVSELCNELTDGSKWDFSRNVCSSPEEVERACVNDKGEWRTDSDRTHCKSGRDLCDELEDGSTWTYMGHDKSVCIPAEDLKSDCKNDGGEWRCRSYFWQFCKCITAEVLCDELTDGSKWDQQKGVCISPEQVCVEAAGEWRTGSCVTVSELCFEQGNEWAYQQDIAVCRPAEEFRRDCKNAGGTWTPKDYAFEFGRCQSAKSICYRENQLYNAWDDEKKVCISVEEAERACVNDGRFWKTYESSGKMWCDDTKDDTVVVSTSLAQADAQTESNYSNAYTGATFGVVGFAATFFLVSTCNKKEVSERQQSLLDGYQSANHL